MNNYARDVEKRKGYAAAIVAQLKDQFEVHKLDNCKSLTEEQKEYIRKKVYGLI